jgi:hypothetical protein
MSYGTQTREEKGSLGSSDSHGRACSELGVTVGQLWIVYSTELSEVMMHALVNIVLHFNPVS